MTIEGKLIHGGWLVRRWDGEEPPAIENGALYEEKGRIVAIGTYGDLHKKYPGARTVGDASYIVAPGFVNAHSHGKGLSTFQMGQADEPLETRIVEIFHRPEWGGQSAEAAKSHVGYDPYLDTLYACAKQVASGITTTLHSHGYFNGPVEPYAEATRKIVRGYRDSGIRCAFTLGIRDRFTFTFLEDRDFLKSIPPEVVSGIEGQMMRCEMTFAQYYELLRALSREYPQVKFQLGPWNPVFCSDDLMDAVADASRREGWRVQTHLVETRYQAEYAKKAYGESWVKRLNDIGMLSDRFSGAHCVWVEESDFAIMKQSKMQVVHNPSSNLRLHSGVAPVRQFLETNIPVAFGLDSLGMNDDDDMFQDLRLGQLLQNNTGVDSRPITASTMLAMATRAGAAVAGIEQIGSLAEGNSADVVLLSRPDIEGVGSGHSLADVVLKRAKTLHVRTVVVGGNVLIEDGRWTARSPAQILRELAAAVQPKTRKPAPTVGRLKDAVREYLRNY